jgi:ribosomal protein L32
VYDEARDRADYKLTAKGRDLWPVMVTLRQWGDDWITKKGKAPVALLHTTCGAQTSAHLVCDHCGERLERREVRSVAGPGMTDDGVLRR